MIEEDKKRLESVYPVKNGSGTRGRIPWAYDKKEGDPDIFIPNWDRIEILEEAFDYMEAGTLSIRKAVDWITVKAGKSISHQGLVKLHQQYRPDSDRLKTRELKRQLEKQRRISREERKEKTLKAKIKLARMRATRSQNQVKKLAAVQTADVSETQEIDISSVSIPEGREVVFTPNPGPQTEFLAAPETQVLFGGAAGGGKSYALLADPMRWFHKPAFNGILLRRTNDELRELIMKSKLLYPVAFPGARWSEKKSSWTFPSGAQLWLTYLERDDDVLRYQGQAFCWIGFDELTQYPTPFPWNYLASRLRSTDPELDVNTSMRATSNPGGPGHGWVKRMFVDPASPNTPFPATDINTGEVLTHPEFYGPSHPLAGQRNPMGGKPLLYRRFIPASLYDNPYLSGGSYEANLLSLPEDQKRQLLDGDWNVASGAAFPEFRTHIHTTKPFEIPSNWRRFRSCDFGYASHSAVHWFAIDPQYETLIVYRELYASKLTALELAAEVLKREQGENISYGILDSSCWHQRGHMGPSIAEEMISAGCRWRPSDRTQGSRVAGKNRLHELLRVNPQTGRPGIIFFDTCRQILADLPVIPTDPDGSDDIDDRYASDHTYDSIRYGIMSRPRSASPFEDWLNSKPIDKYQPYDTIFGY